MMKELEILMQTGMSKRDAERHIENGVEIYEVEEFLNNFENYAEALEDEDKEKLRKFLENNKTGIIWDNDLVEYDGKRYYIEYSL